MLLLIDYGIGNLRSLEKAFQAVGAEPVRSDDPANIARADKLVLPGVGAFGACGGERGDGEHASVAGVQFHPEKREDAGLRLLRNFADRGMN